MEARTYLATLAMDVVGGPGRDAPAAAAASALAARGSARDSR